MSPSEHAKKFRCEACSTLSDFELLDEELITKIETEHTCPRCHATGSLELLFQVFCIKCQTENLINEAKYHNVQTDVQNYKCEICLAEEERIRREEEERKRREEEAERLRQVEEARKREEEERKRREEENERRAEREAEEEERERAEAQARAEEELRLAQPIESVESEKDIQINPMQKLAPEDQDIFEKIKNVKKVKTKKKSETREYLEAFFTALLIALFLRAFVVEAFKIPSKSMVPNLLVGDHLFVNKFIYGIRVPFTKEWIAKFKTPQRGEVVVFSWPKDESLDFIKRVVGVPGDKIRIDKRDLYVNDQKMNVYPVQVEGVDPENIQKLKITQIEGPVQDNKFANLPYMVEWKDYNYFVEDLSGVQHFTQYMKPLWPHPENEWIVPPGHLFAMGDNRDNSSDSREWGFVPMENLRGRALFIWFSWDSESVNSPWYAIQDWPKKIRWGRFGKAIE